MKIKRVVFGLLPLLCVLPSHRVLAAEPPPPRLTGLVHFAGQSHALLEIPSGRRVESPPPLVPGDVQGQWEIVQINDAQGSVALKNSATQKELLLTLTNTVATSAVPRTFRLESAPLGQVLEVFQMVSGRTLIRAQKLPDAHFSLTTGALSGTNEATQALVQLLAASDLVITNVGAKFAAVVPSAQLPAVASLPPLPKGLPGSAPPAPNEMLGSGSIMFKDGDALQALDIYGLYLGRAVLHPERLEAKINLANQTPLTLGEAAWAMEAVFHLAGYDTLAVGGKFVCIAPPETLKRVPMFDAAEAASRMKSGGEPVSIHLLEAEAKQALTLYASLAGRQAVPLAGNLASMRLTVGPGEALPPAEAVYALEATAVLNGLRFERVGEDKVQLVPLGPQERSR